MSTQDSGRAQAPPAAPARPQPITVENFKAFFEPIQPGARHSGISIERTLDDWLRFMNPWWFSEAKTPEREYLSRLGIDDPRTLERAVAAFRAYQRGRTVKEVRPYRGQNGKLGLESAGEDWAIHTEVDWQDPFGDSRSHRKEATAFTEGITNAEYDQVEEISRERDPCRNCSRELRYRVRVGGKVGVLAVMVSAPEGWHHDASDRIETRRLLPTVYDAVAEVCPGGGPARRHVAIARTVRKTWRGQADHLQVLDYPNDRLREANVICEAGTWNDLVSRLRAKLPGVSEESLDDARAALGVSR